MSELFLKLFNMSIMASWLVLAVIVLRLLLKKAPKWMNCVLWGLVGLRLLLPFSLESVFSLIPSAETIPHELISSHSFDIQTGIAAIDVPINEYLGDHYYEGVSVPADNGSTVVQALCIVWLAGIAALLIYSVVSYLRLRRRVKTAVLLRDNIYQSEKAVSPFVLGFFRPRIYLPFGMAETATESVVAHEKAHIKRRDHIIKPVGYLLLTVYWFNPVLWAAYILLCRDIELACDERVIRELDGDERADYSEALLLCSMPHKLISTCPLAFGEVGVKERVKSVLNYKKPAFWLIAVAAVACIVVAVCFLTNPKANEADEPFGRNYSVETIVYAAPQYSFSYTPQTAPDYRLTADRKLLIMEDKDSNNWRNVGTFAEESLSPLTFDDYFWAYDGVSGWEDAQINAEKLRVNTQKAWRLDVPEGNPDNVFYLLLQLKNGDVCLTYGYDSGKGSAEAKAGSLIRWVFKLGTLSTTGTGGTDAPAQATASDTYMYSVTVYMNPLSSYTPAGTTGYLYKINEKGSLSILNEKTGEVLASVSNVGLNWSPLSAEDWQALFTVGEAPDISGIHEPLVMRLSDKYYLFDMDGGLWLGEYSGDKSGMWSVYELKLYEQQRAPSAADVL